MLDQFAEEITQLKHILIVFALILPLEYFLNRSKKTSPRGLVFNFIVMLLYVFGGGVLVKLALQFVTVPFVSPVIENPYLYTVVFILLVDILFYLYHRLQHRWPLLWKVHRLHHSDLDMNITTSFRTNLFDNLIQYFVIITPVYLIMGTNYEAAHYCYYGLSFFLFFGHLKAQNSWGVLSKIIVTPEVHRIHHSQDKAYRDKNFAQVFPFLDMLGRTHAARKKDDPSLNT